MNLRAYAKVNIGLRILKKRPDGYHDIETIFRQINLYDELTLDPADSTTLVSSSPDIPHDSTNLCIRAAHLLQQQIRRDKGVAIRLTKHIPVGGGLGGGSSDAAMILVGLNKLWNVGMNNNELESIAAGLGSDVPFLIMGGTAAGTSRGEVLDHFELKMPYWMLTVTPPIHISTGWAYSHVHVKDKIPPRDLRSVVEESIRNPGVMRERITNDFESMVYKAHPQIQQIKDKLESSGALLAQLSGSGSSVFALFRDEQSALAAADTFADSSVTSITAPDFKPYQSP